MKAFVLAASLAVLIAFISAGFVYATTSAEQSYSKGVDYAAEGELDKADKEFKDALSKDKSSALAKACIRVLKDAKTGKVAKDAVPYIIKGDGFATDKLPNKAIESYSEAIRIDPGYAPIYYRRGNAYNNQDRYELAIVDYSKALELDPDHYCACGNRAGIYLYKKQYDKALEGYTRAIEISPEHAWGYARRGDVYYELKKFDLAIADYNKAIELDPKDADVFYDRGHAFVRQGHYGSALTDIDRVIHLNPDDVRGYELRGYIYRKQAKYELADADFTMAIELDPDNVWSYLNRGFILSEMGQKERARQEQIKGVLLYLKDIFRPTSYTLLIYSWFFRFIFIVFIGIFILRFATSRNFGRIPRFVPGTNFSCQPSHAQALGVLAVAFLLTNGTIELLRYIVFPPMGVTLLNGRFGGLFLSVLIGFVANAIVYSRLLKYPESGPIGFRSACYISLIVYVIWLWLFILFMLPVYLGKAIFGFIL